MTTPFGLNYDFCICCGCMIKKGQQLCRECTCRGFEKIRRTSLKDLRYPEVPDPLDWMTENTGLPKGYNDLEGREALKDLINELIDIKNESDKSRKVG